MAEKNEWARWVPVDATAAKELEDLAPVNSIVVYDPGEITNAAGTALNPDLLSKSPAITMVGSGISGTDAVLRVIVYHRREDRKQILDHTAYGILYSSHGTQESGCYIHHGEYDREVTFSDDDWRHLLNRGIGELKAQSDIPTMASGSLFDITDKCRLAVEKVYEYYRDTIESLPKMAENDDP